MHLIGVYRVHIYHALVLVHYNLNAELFGKQTSCLIIEQYYLWEWLQCEGEELYNVTIQSELSALWRKLGISSSGSPGTYGPSENLCCRSEVCSFVDTGIFINGHFKYLIR